MAAKILLMSDSPQTLIIAEETVRNLGYECHTVSSADEALDMLPKLKPNAAILDFTISRGDAYRVREHLREFGTRIIGIVPQGAGDEEIFAEIELDAILEKPITEEKVKEVLQDLVVALERKLADNAKINVLRKLLDEGLNELLPEPSPSSPTGHAYPVRNWKFLKILQTEDALSGSFLIKFTFAPSAYTTTLTSGNYAQIAAPLI